MQMNTGAAIGKWFYWIMAFDILLSIVVGFIVGYVARKLLRFCKANDLIDNESFLVFSIALAVSIPCTHEEWLLTFFIYLFSFSLWVL